MPLYKNSKLLKLLQDLQVIDESMLLEASEQASESNELLGDVLLDKDLITDENLAKAIADLLNITYISLARLTIEEDTLKIIPELVAKKNQIIAFKKDNEALHLATTRPDNLEVFEFIKTKVNYPLKIYFTSKRDISDVLRLYNRELTEVFDKLIYEQIRLAKASKDKELNLSIIKIIDTIISYAHTNKASDVHIEPTEEQSVVRFRIDGILHDIVKIPIEIHDQLVNRVKVMAKLRTDDQQSAQDGKIEFNYEEEKIDIRVSIVPITRGEKIVLRLLSEKARRFSLKDLGLSKHDYDKIYAFAKKPYGALLATGPTGSGKTTTIYAVLKVLNRRKVNIMTIEDPVEYAVEGVNQIQVNTKTELTFAKGLRSIVRQDPDIIFVGEIRDDETAGIAINSSMTGHLVLSTLHTNDAATAIPRLVDMTIEPYLIASSVNLIIAQRLVRKICMNCRTSYVEKAEHLHEIFSKEQVEKSFGKSKEIRVYKGKGCEICHNTGYMGRVGVFEVMIVDEKIKEAIIAREDAADIKKLAIKNGMSTMMEDGIEKVKEGITTIEELLRVTKE